MPIASFQVNLVLKMKYTPNAKKFGTQNNLSTLIINMIFKIADLDPKLNTWADLVSKLLVANFHKIWHSEQTEHANYEYISWK